MQLDPNTTEPVDAGGAAPLPEDGATSTRTFILLAIGLAVVFLCLAGGLGFYAFVLQPQQRAAQKTQAAAIVLTNTQIAMLNANIQKTAAVTATPVPPTATALPSDTPLPVKTAEAGGIASPTPLLAFTATNTPLAAAVSNTPAVTPSVTFTVAPSKTGPTPTKTKVVATPTLLVIGIKTATPTQLPGTGFADEAGVPMLIVLSVALVGVAVIVRRVRLGLR
jgi:hypothetical protein